MVEGDECRYCEDNGVVPVLDKSIERNPTGGGNKYRRRCLLCEKWNPMTSEEYYREHLHPHVLPVGADDDEVIPLEEYDYGPEWADLAEQAGVDPDDETEDVGTGTRMVADGGDPVEDVHEFECPRCGAHQTGRPDRCGSCNAPYEW